MWQYDGKYPIAAVAIGHFPCALLVPSFFLFYVHFSFLFFSFLLVFYLAIGRKISVCKSFFSAHCLPPPHSNPWFSFLVFSFFLFFILRYVEKYTYVAVAIVYFPRALLIPSFFLIFLPFFPSPFSCFSFVIFQIMHLLPSEQSFPAQVVFLLFLLFHSSFFFSSFF